MGVPHVEAEVAALVYFVVRKPSTLLTLAMEREGLDVGMARVGAIDIVTLKQ